MYMSSCHMLWHVYNINFNCPKIIKNFILKKNKLKIYQTTNTNSILSSICLQHCLHYAPYGAATITFSNIKILLRSRGMQFQLVVLFCQFLELRVDNSHSKSSCHPLQSDNFLTYCCIRYTFVDSCVNNG